MMNLKFMKAKIKSLDLATSNKQVIPLQYNPETLTRTLSISNQAEGSPIPQNTPPKESYKMKAILDATDLLEKGDTNTLNHGIQPMLTALELLIHASSKQLTNSNNLAKKGVLEITPPEAPLVLFTWNKDRTVPIRITQLSITEEAFDPQLNPIRASIDLGFDVLTTSDLGYAHKGGQQYMTYLQRKEALSRKFFDKK
jgi:hypothetical protein